jgi:hypothetical protein
MPNGDTIEFAESAPLQVRKDMLAIAFYRLVLRLLLILSFPRAHERMLAVHSAGSWVHY